jgi:hypothetical protein
LEKKAERVKQRGETESGRKRVREEQERSKIGYLEVMVAAVH